MIEFRIDRRSGVAAYLRLVQQTRQALRLGLLEPGDQLPTASDGTFIARSLPRDAAAVAAQLSDWMGRARDAGLEREDVEAVTRSVIDQHY